MSFPKKGDLAEWLGLRSLFNLSSQSEERGDGRSLGRVHISVKGKWDSCSCTCAHRLVPEPSGRCRPERLESACVNCVSPASTGTTNPLPSSFVSTLLSSYCVHSARHSIYFISSSSFYVRTQKLREVVT